MTDIVERLDTFDWWSFEPGAAIYAEAKLRRDAKAEIERLRTDGQEGRQLAADNFERAKKAEAEVKRLRAELNACGLDCEAYFNRSEYCIETERQLRAEIERLKERVRVLEEQIKWHQATGEAIR